MHISISNAGSPTIKECNSCCGHLFHCLLCPTFKPTKKANIQRRVDTHAKQCISKITEWVQCYNCEGWPHTDCAGPSYPHLRDGTFCCGREASDACNRAIELLHTHGIQGLLSADEIKSLHEQLKTGIKRSNRMCLWENPTASLNLKLRLKPNMLHFDENQVIIRILEKNECFSCYWAKYAMASEFHH
ncbi:uncharacterized protein LOC118223457 isoform X2 [Anguilla anguilla]|uniref:uncharacterized protein LOC118223457 isoform X2 n=1 Tax=Anguilla anguilla TaxID=7936 RepID=UPI0015A762CA|nr:uncharacterized protein LOC118223457 isoform X2 [Anguilla anguilla]